MALLAPLGPDERTTFLVVCLPRKEIQRLAGQLGTVEKGKRLDKLSEWDLAWSLTDYYEEADVCEAVDATLAKELGEPPLAPAVAAAGAGEAIAELVWQSKDPARDLAWALLRSPAEGAGAVAQQMVQRIIAEFDAADERAKEEAAKPPPEPESDAEREARERERKAERDRQARERERKRLEETKERVTELEQGLAGVRRALRVAEDARERLEQERRRLAEERDALRAELKSGTPAEVLRLKDELESAGRRMRALEADVDEARGAEATLSQQVRRLEAERSARPAATGEEGPDDRPASSGPGWCVPIFTDEFYESIRRWDRKIVRNAFEKVYRLAEDWRHPSLRAIPLEGLPDCFRIRVATDVRLIYRPLDGNRVEIMSLIDREDLQRYIRQAKTR